MLLLVAAPNGSDISSTRGRQARGFTEAGFHNRGNVCAQQSWPSLEAVSPSDMGAHPTFVPTASPHQPQSLCSLDSGACRVLATQSPQISWSLFGSLGHSRAVPGRMCSEKCDAFIRDLRTTATPMVGMWPVLLARRAACEGLESARVPHGEGGRTESMWTPLRVQSGGQTTLREGTLDGGPLLPHWWGETSLL